MQFKSPSRLHDEKRVAEPLTFRGCKTLLPLASAAKTLALTQLKLPLNIVCRS